MHDRLRALFAEDPRQQVGVLDVAFVERDSIGHGKAKAGGQVVDHRDGPAAVGQRKDGVAADIAGAAGDEDGRSVGHAAFLSRSTLPVT